MNTVTLVTGSSGFIGGHLVKALQERGDFVIGADIETPKYNEPDVFYQYDLRNQLLCNDIFAEYPVKNVYNLACLMGGMGYIGDSKHSYDIMVGSSQIVSNIINCCVRHGVEKSFYSSSACCYNMTLQERADAVALKETDAYPAMPDLVYGWQKLFSEQMYQAAHQSADLNIRIARFHNIFGPEGTYDGGKEKAPSAICRKVAMAKDGENIEVWGTGEATRSFLFIDECISGILRLMQSDCTKPVNIGSSESISINNLAKMIIYISGKKLGITNVPSGTVGVAGRNSDNTMIEEELNWKPTAPLIDGMTVLYDWVNKQVNP